MLGFEPEIDKDLIDSFISEESILKTLWKKDA